MGVNMEERICLMWSKWNKCLKVIPKCISDKAKTCSRSCASKLAWESRTN